MAETMNNRSSLTLFALFFCIFPNDESGMEVSRLPISASLKAKLILAGYTSLSSLSSLSSTDLAQELSISDTEALKIQKFASYNSRLATFASNGITASVNVAQTAWDLLHEEQLVPRITTSCADLDSILGGGINCGEVTEIGGVPGIGKTQMGIQLAVNAQIPVEYGGLGGKAVYIDTEGSFMVERVIQIAEACLEDMVEYRGTPRKDLRSCKVKIQLNDILGNIYYFRICSYTEQIALINFLDKFITEHKDVKVVIVDSVAFHFRQDFDDLALRTRLLGEISLKLMKLSKKFNLAVVLFNQATIKYTDGAFQLALALGDSWSNYCTNRVILYWNGDDRYAYIDKSPSLQSASTPYSITSRGIRNSASSYKRIKM